MHILEVRKTSPYLNVRIFEEEKMHNVFLFSTTTLNEFEKNSGHVFLLLKKGRKWPPKNAGHNKLKQIKPGDPSVFQTKF